MKKSNIGIMTFHRAHNYGALLQALALQSFLEYRYNVFFLDFYNKKIYNSYKPFKSIGKNFIKWPCRIVDNIKHYNINKRTFEIFNNFINNNLKIDKYNLKKVNECDVLITGSDQVWNPEITGGLLDEYTLNIGNDNIKRISYAASCGAKEIITKYKISFKNKLKVIDSISIREESSIKELNRLLPSKEIRVVLDPTLLLTKEQWERKINDCAIKEKYILAYVVAMNEEYVKIVNDLANKTGLKVLSFSSEKLYNNQMLDDGIYGPLEFVSLIKNADYIVTTSFHATVFSIIFNKKFWVVPHKKTGSRVIDLLNKLEMSNRAISSLEEFKVKDYDENIEYKESNKKLEVERKKSIDWLINAIEK